MATATATPGSRPDRLQDGTNGAHAILTWEEYLAEGVVWERYDIVGGVRQFMSSPGVLHQIIVSNVHDILRAYQRKMVTGVALFAPLDVVIRRHPRLQTRQPDNLFIDADRLKTVPDYQNNGFITVAPNLITEVLSNSDRENIVQAKLADYFAIGVAEAWLIRPEQRTVTVMVRGLTEWAEVAQYTKTEILLSATLPGLSAPVADLFQP